MIEVLIVNKCEHCDSEVYLPAIDYMDTRAKIISTDFSATNIRILVWLKCVSSFPESMLKFLQ